MNFTDPTCRNSNWSVRTQHSCLFTNYRKLQCVGHMCMCKVISKATVHRKLKKTLEDFNIWEECSLCRNLMCARVVILSEKHDANVAVWSQIGHLDDTKWTVWSHAVCFFCCHFTLDYMATVAFHCECDPRAVTWIRKHNNNNLSQKWLFVTATISTGSLRSHNTLLLTERSRRRRAPKRSFLQFPPKRQLAKESAIACHCQRINIKTQHCRVYISNHRRLYQLRTPPSPRQKWDDDSTSSVR